MELHTELLACKEISEAARKELERVAFTIFKQVPGLDTDIEVVELQYTGGRDRSGMSVWDIPREIQIASRNLYLNYAWNDEVNGYALTTYGEIEARSWIAPEKPEEESLGDLDDHPF